MEIPILSGIYADNSPAVRTDYPVNLVPTPRESGVSSQFLRPGFGIENFGTGPGIDRGGINWDGVCYRVMGSQLVRVSADGTIVSLGNVGGTSEYVSLTYSFDLLAIASGGRLYYYNPVSGSLSQVTDSDLGTVLDVRWIDGYFMTTDGTSLVVTELNDPFSVNPLKYGSSEVDPDPIKALRKLRNEMFAVNRYTIEVFDNIGGSFFPFQRVDGAQITKGAVGTYACCVYLDSIAFLGGGRNEPPAIYLGVNSRAQKVSTAEIDYIIQTFTDEELSNVKLEAKSDRSHEHLMIHLPDRTLVFDGAASQAMGKPVWFQLTTALAGFERYRAENFVWAHDQWIVGDPKSSNLGTIKESVSSHWGNPVRWQFSTIMFYNSGRGALVHELELVSQTGNIALGINPTINTSYSTDGRQWSMDKPIQIGSTGSTQKRLVWFQNGFLKNYRIQRFNGDSQSHLSFLRLEAKLEPMVF